MRFPILKNYFSAIFLFSQFYFSISSYLPFWQLPESLKKGTLTYVRIEFRKR